MKVTPEFLSFFNRAAALSSALYAPGAAGLNFAVHILPSQGIRSVTFQLDAQQLSGSSGSHPFTWSPQTSHQAQLTAAYATGSLPLLQFNGPWALFHLVDKGHVSGAGNPVTLDYPLEVSGTPIVVNGTPLIVHLELTGRDASLLRPGGLRMRCVSRVAR